MHRIPSGCMHPTTLQTGGSDPPERGSAAFAAPFRRPNGDESRSVQVASGSAVLFPGQGVSVARARERVEAALPLLRARADELIGEDCFERAGESTRFAQPAIFLSSLAAFAELEGADGRARVRRPFAGRAHGARRRRRAQPRGRPRARRAARAADGRVGPIGWRRQHARAAARHARAGARGRRRGRRLGRQRQRPRPDRARRPARGAAAGGGDRPRARRAHARARGHGRLPLAVDGRRPGAVSGGARARRAQRAGGHRLLGADGAAVRRRSRRARRGADRRRCAGARRWQRSAAFGAHTFIDVGPDQVLARLVARNVEGVEAIALEELAA